MMTKDDNQVRLTLRIPEELHASVKEIANKKNMSVNSYIINSLRSSTSKIDLTLSVVTTDEGDFCYVLPVPPEWFTEIKCGETDSFGNVMHCIDCQRSTTKEIPGCGKTINLT